MSVSWATNNRYIVGVLHYMMTYHALYTVDYRVTSSHSDFALECHCRCL